jgi:alpha-tubulin suppressor-like RCC1 family protein
VIAVSGGIEYTVALKADGTVVAWGRNDMGQLGDGTTTDRLNPVAVPGLYGIVAIAAGGYHTLALKADGGVWAWGHNGDGTTNNRATPVPGLSDVMAIAAGQAHTVALKRDQTVWAWGNNSFGQLGDGTRRHYRFLPVQVTMADGSPLRGVMGITAGYKHTVALKSDGSVWAWGGGIGEEERGRASARLTPLPVKLADGSPLSGIIAVAAGSLYTQALKADGTVWGWRDNQRGELGSGVWTSREIFPVQAKLPDGSPLSGITAIATGKRHTVARKDDGTVWACGKNAYGQLGAGKISFPADSLVQVRLRDGAPLSGVVALAAGGNHTVAIVVEAEESVGVSE